MLIKKYLYLFSALTLIFLNPASGQDYSISAETFGKLPEISDVEISPDGSKILYLQNYQGSTIIVTKSLINPSLGTNGIPTEAGEYKWARWTSNDKILASVRFSSKRASGRGLVDSIETRLVTFDWDGKNFSNPIALKNPNSLPMGVPRKQNIPQFQDDVIDMMMDDPDHILIQLDLEEALSTGVYKINLKTKKRERILRGRGVIQEWKTDDNHVVRYGEGRSRKRGTDKVRYVAYYRKKDNDGWDTLFEYEELTEKPPFDFIEFTDDPSIIYISKLNDAGNIGYYKYNVDNNDIIEEISDSEKQKILGGRSTRLKKIFAANFPDENVRIMTQTPDEKVLVLKVTSPTNPGSFYILDFNKGAMDPIAYNYAALDYEKLSKMTAVSYTARDGLTINGYLSLPKGSDGTKLPTVIMPHGGPWGVRDTWKFDYWVQFLTARGYAVLQMNYRGSSGYGSDFEEMGHREWGRKMLEDINDGTKWMIDQDYTDEKNICIMGASYGDYAALQAVVKDTALYKCSVSFAPVTDMESFMIYKKKYTDYSIYENYVVSDEWSLKEASPTEHIDKFDIPVLLMHGDIDRAVRVQQSRDFYKEMSKAGKDIKYIEFEEGDHNLSKEVHRIELLQEVEKFLEEHL